jgi:xanthine dehydrogenase accessory factor
MWVAPGGRLLGSVTIGGCVDAQVMAEAEGVLGEGGPQLLEMSLGDEDAWEIGLTCGGTIEVFLEPVVLDGDGQGVASLYRRLRAHTEAGRAGALVTRLDPPGAGAKLLALDDGAREGTLGSAALDEAAAAAAGPLLHSGLSRTVHLPDPTRPGGQVRAFVEVHTAAATLLVVGAGHVAMPLVRLARVLGLRTVVIDGRPRLATRARFPEVDELLVGMPSELVRARPLSPATAVVLVAHDYKYDVPVLRHVLATDVWYAGMLGSRRRGEAIRKMLREDGVEEAALARLRSPFGLDLGSQTAPEIALAILAEVVAARYGRSGGALSAAPR